ncbi:MAG: endolytic transglycosylase MltG [Acidimicrobiales bacterium]
MTDTELFDQEESREQLPDGNPGRRRTLAVSFGVVVLVGLILASAAGLWYQRQVDPPGSPGADVHLTIPVGTSTQAIGEMLAEAGVIGDTRAFKIWLRLHGRSTFDAGDYTFRRNMSFGQAVAVLDDGPEVSFDSITIPEGLTLEQVAERVGKLPGRSAEAFLAAARSGEVRSSLMPPGTTNLEGLLLPETYNVDPDEGEKAILQRMVGAFEDLTAELGFLEAPAKVGVKPYEAVIIASLVEREARRDEDRGQVAAVVYNRLERGMLLQIDAAILYALGHKSQVLNRDLEIDSPYNLYKRAGLPPTPIAMSGRAALAAAIGPPTHDFFYYVTINDCTGETVFGKTLADHNRNVARRKAENC